MMTPPIACKENKGLTYSSKTNFMQDSNNPTDDRPKIWVVNRQIGELSQVWIERQLDRFTRIAPTLLYWEKANDTAILSKFPQYQLPIPQTELHRWRKWTSRLINVPSINFESATPDEFEELSRINKETAPSAILCHFGQTALRLLPFARRHGIPLVAHFHGLDLSSSLNNRWYRWSLLKNLNKFSAIVVVGEVQKEWMLKNGVPKEKLALIPCGVPTEEFFPHERPSTQSPNFITVSRLVPWKGVDICIDAFALLLKQEPNATLEIVGDGPSLEDLKKQAHELGIGSSVKFAGPLDSNSVRDRLQQSHVFLQHSLNHTNGWYEGFGVSITEASAMNLPVIASRCGGIPDQVVHEATGFLTGQRDVKAFSDAMLVLARDEARRNSMGRSGRLRAIECFDTKKQVSKLENVILGLVKPTSTESGLKR